jgi:hypothetical protein
VFCQQISLPASAAAQVALSLHSTHWPPLQMGVATGQSVFARHATQSPAAVSQNGVGAAHAASLVHPARQRIWSVQIGVATGQSAFVTHTTHCPLRTLQKGAAIPQFELARHATHWPVTASQSGRPWTVWQSVSAVHCTQADWALQMAALFWPGMFWHDAFVVHAA